MKLNNSFKFEFAIVDYILLFLRKAAKIEGLKSSFIFGLKNGAKIGFGNS